MKDWNGVAHPDWCDMDRCAVVIDETGHRTAVEHMSRPITCDRTGDDQVSVAAYLWQPIGRPDLSVIKVEIVDEQCGVGYPLLPDQAQALGDALATLVTISTREPTPALTLT